MKITILLANMHIDSGYLAVVKKEGFLESMARDMRHPYTPSTTVLGDRNGPHARHRRSMGL